MKSRIQSVVSEQRSRFIRPRVIALEPESVLSFSERVDARRARGERIAKLTLGQSPFPVPDALVQALREAAGQKAYAPPRGLPELRRAVASYVRRRLGIDRVADDVIIGPGSKELLFLLLLVFDGEIVIPTPGWGSWGAQVRVLGREAMFVHARAEAGFLVRPEDIDAALSRAPQRPRLLLLNYPSSPTGLTYRPEELEAFAEIARRHNLFVLSDEVYGELHHKGQHVSLARYHPDGTIVSTGLSKWVGAGGWRLGCFVFPERLRPLADAMERVASETYSSTSMPIQRAATVAFEGSDDIERYLAQVRRLLSALGRVTARRLEAKGLRCAQPSGGFYVFADFGPVWTADNTSTSRHLVERLVDEAGVALVPGSAFGRPLEELTARLAYVDFDGAKALSAVGVIPKEQPLDETFLRRHCSPVIEAVERIGEFVESIREAGRRLPSTR